MKTNPKIAIYSRKSRFTGKGESIGNQIELCKNYVTSLYGEAALEQVQIFEDEGFSGGNLNRPAFQRMLEALRRGVFRAIVVYRLDRISRNISDFTALIDELTRLGVSFISIREQFDTGTPMGRAMMYIISVFSQLERETIAQRIRDNMHELAKTGRWLGGNTPTGYASESVCTVTLDGKSRKVCCLRPIPEEAALVQTIFDLYLQTDSLTATESELLRRRLKTKRGRDFTRFSIKAILENPVYAIADTELYGYFAERTENICAAPEEFDGTSGMMVYHRTDQEKGRAAVLLPVSEWIIAVGKHPGLIPAAQWIRVQMSLERNKCKSYRKPRINPALLTGLLFCSCGQRMYPKLTGRQLTTGDPAFSYVCKLKERSKGVRCGAANLAGNDLDGRILQYVTILPEDMGHFCNCLARSSLKAADEWQEAQTRSRRDTLAENRRKIRGLLDAVSLAQGAQVRQELLLRLEELTQACHQIEASLRTEDAVGEMPALDPAVLGKRWASFPETMEEMTLEEKRSMVRTLIHRVDWDGTAAHMTLSAHWCEDSK